MFKICALSLGVVALLVVASGCTKTTTVTITPSPVTVTATQPVTPSQSVVTTTSTYSSVQIPTTTLTVISAVTPTATTSLYQGTLKCSWTGQITNGTATNGTFSLTIDKNGDVTGTGDGSYTGTILGQVDLVGNLIAMGVLTGSSTPVSTSYDAKITLSGNALSVQGNWTSSYGSGTFSGTGSSTR